MKENNESHLQPWLREVVDPGVLHRAHVQLQDDDVGICARNRLPTSSDQRLQALLLDVSQGGIRGCYRVSGKLTFKRILPSWNFIKN